MLRAIGAGASAVALVAGMHTVEPSLFLIAVLVAPPVVGTLFALPSPATRAYLVNALAAAAAIGIGLGTFAVGLLDRVRYFAVMAPLFFALAGVGALAPLLVTALWRDVRGRPLDAP